MPETITCPSPSKEREKPGKEIQGLLVITVFVMKKIFIINPNQKSPGNPRPPNFFPISLQNFSVAHSFTQLFSGSTNIDYMPDIFMGSGKITVNEKQFLTIWSLCNTENDTKY